MYVYPASKHPKLHLVTDVMIDVGMCCHPCSITTLFMCFLVLSSLLNLFIYACLFPFCAVTNQPSCSLCMAASTVMMNAKSVGKA